MVKWWFGFGIPRVPLSNNPFHKGIPNIQATGPKPTINHKVIYGIFWIYPLPSHHTQTQRQKSETDASLSLN